MKHSSHIISICVRVNTRYRRQLHGTETRRLPSK